MDFDGKTNATERFCKIVLGWDYFRLVREAREKTMMNNPGGETVSGLKIVKNTYEDIEDYVDTYEPLLFEELKAQIIQRQDFEEASRRYGRTSVCGDSDGFHFPLIICSKDKKRRMLQNDLILLSQDEIRNFQDTAEAKQSNYAFALVEYSEETAVKLKMYLVGEVERVNVEEVVSCERLSNMQSWLSRSGRSCCMLKICNLSTIFGQYVALRSISSLPFKDLILTATETNLDSEDHGRKIPAPLMGFIKANYNESQLEAISAALSRRTFVLIQVPPGTGKNPTILGLLSVILHATPETVNSTGLQEPHFRSELPIEEKFDHWRRASPWLTGINPRDAIMPIDGDDGFFPYTGNDLKPEVVKSRRKYRVRVLVCAPTNSALDEIVLHLMRTGVRDENDQVCKPKIVRIGPEPHHSIRGVSMEYLVKQRLNNMDINADGNDNSKMQSSIMDGADIVFSTLSFSGSTLFTKFNHGYDIVIIDEASQAVEPATLVPLTDKCKRVYLVGDQAQRPSNVISPVAEKFGYGTSLFERFQKAGYPVFTLTTNEDW